MSLGLDSDWPDSVTFQSPDNNGTYQDVSGLTALEGRVQQIQLQSIRGDQPWTIELGVSHKILLRGYYPTVTFDMRIKVNDTDYYQIMQNGVRHADKRLTSVLCSGTGPGA
jgi:hypothetical protein